MGRFVSLPPLTPMEVWKPSIVVRVTMKGRHSFPFLEEGFPPVPSMKKTRPKAKRAAEKRNLPPPPSFDLIRTATHGLAHTMELKRINKVFIKIFLAVCMFDKRFLMSVVTKTCIIGWRRKFVALICLLR